MQKNGFPELVFSRKKLQNNLNITNNEKQSKAFFKAGWPFRF